MLKQLVIKNFAIVDDLEINFADEFNVIVGETGSGKSIIVKAINLLLGERSSSALIKDGYDKSYLKLLFSLNEAVAKILDDLAIFYDDEVELTRILNINGKSVFKINGQIVNLQTVKKMRPFLLDLYSQDERFNFFSNLNLLEIMSNFEDDSKELISYQKIYQKYCKLKEKMEELKNKTSRRDYEYYKMQLEEILKIAPQETELTTLKKQAEQASNYEKICQSKNQFTDLKSRILSDLEHLHTLLSDLDQFYDLDLKRFDELNLDLNDFLSDLDINVEENQFDIDSIEERIFTITQLYKKYDNSYKTMLDFQKECEEYLYNFENSEYLLEKYVKELIDVEKELTLKAKDLQAKRVRASEKIVESINDKLVLLRMENDRVKIVFHEKAFHELGNVEAEILISTNLGTYKKISEIASGGEKTRLIFAIKLITSQKQANLTLIFDEIDTGVSGRVAKAMGKEMKQLALFHQVICISHSPQIVACAKHFYHVQKQLLHNEISSNLLKLREEEIITLIASLLSGDEVSEIALENARVLRGEML